jgi:hypothetical protein
MGTFAWRTYQSSTSSGVQPQADPLYAGHMSFDHVSIRTACYFGARGGHLGHHNYMDKFADNVVAMLGQAVATCMAANLQGFPDQMPGNM